MKSTLSAVKVAFLGFVLLALGFITGLGYQSWQHSQKSEAPDSAVLQPPVVRNLRVSPQGQRLAFTAIYNDASQAGRFVFDLKSYRWHEAKSPDGWQDSIVQWNEKGDSILFQREKIPRAVANTTAGLYRETLSDNAGTPQLHEAENVADTAPEGEKITTGFWTNKEQLVLKTRRESKALYLRQGRKDVLLDRSPGTYLQNRAVIENGRNVFYAVRDVASDSRQVALFRIVNGKSHQIGQALSDVVWAYLAENARQMIVCRYAPNGKDWQWSLYRIGPNALTLVKQNMVPEDVIAVYWSPNDQQILGAAGKSLWIVELPTLRARRLGTRQDWNADDAAWLPHENAVIVAASGHLWKVNTTDGSRREVWKFPNEYWREVRKN